MQVQFSRTHIVQQFVILEQMNRLNQLQLFADLFALVFDVSNVKDPQTLPRNSSPKRGSFSAPWDTCTNTKTSKRLKKLNLMLSAPVSRSILSFTQMSHVGVLHDPANSS